MSESVQPLSPARIELISNWPEVLKPWSIPKAGAKVHALLLSSEAGMTAEEIVLSLGLSTGSVSEQLRFLVESGLLDRVKILGKRRIIFHAVQDPARIFLALAAIRRNAVSTPIQYMSESLASIANKEDARWLTAISQMQALSRLMDDWLRVCSTRDPEWTANWIQKGIHSSISKLNA